MLKLDLLFGIFMDESAECEAARMRVITIKAEGIVLSQKMMACPFQLKDGRSRVELNCLMILAKKMDSETDGQLGGASAEYLIKMPAEHLLPAVGDRGPG